MLTCARFRDDAAFVHPSRQQHLPHRIIDLVRASVQKIFAFQINLRSASMRRQPSRVKQWRRAASVIAQQLIEFLPKIIVMARARKFFSQLLQRRDQDFWNVASAKSTPMPALVGFTFGDL